MCRSIFLYNQVETLSQVHSLPSSIEDFGFLELTSSSEFIVIAFDQSLEAFRSESDGFHPKHTPFSAPVVQKYL